MVQTRRIRFQSFRRDLNPLQRLNIDYDVDWSHDYFECYVYIVYSYDCIMMER